MYSLIPFFLLVTITAHGAPIPAFEVEMVKEGMLNIDTSLEAKVQGALPIVNKQVTGMKKCADNPTDPKCAEILKASFGKDGVNYNHNNVKDLVNKMQDYKAPILKMPFLDGVYGFVDPDQKGSKKKIALGQEFMSADTTDRGRAGTLIHEASHAIANTADTYYNDLKSFIAKEPVKEDKFSHGYHYGSMRNGPQSVADVNKDKKWGKQRDEANNNDNNADSYRVFGALCEGIARRELALAMYKRALDAGDHEQARDLLKRQSCPIPLRKKKTAAPSGAGAASKANATPSKGTAKPKNANPKSAGTINPTPGGRNHSPPKSAISKATPSGKSSAKTPSKSGSKSGAVPSAKSHATGRSGAGAASKSHASRPTRAASPRKSLPASNPRSRAPGSRTSRPAGTASPTKSSPATNPHSRAPGSRASHPAGAASPKKSSPATNPGSRAPGHSVAPKSRASRPSLPPK